MYPDCTIFICKLTKKILSLPKRHSVMFKNFIHRITDLTHIHHRAAFVDVPERTKAADSAFLKLARERYSCRSFSAKPVPDSAIAQIAEAARIAPTAANKQPVHIWVLRSPEALEKVKTASQYIYDAPVVFAVGFRQADAWVRKYDGKNGAEIDSAIVGSHIMLEAADLGLGCVWVGSFDPAALAAQFPQFEGYEISALFPLGWPSPNAAPSPNHTKRAAPEDFCTEL